MPREDIERLDGDIKKVSNRVEGFIERDKKRRKNIFRRLGVIEKTTAEVNSSINEILERLTALEGGNSNNGGNSGNEDLLPDSIDEDGDIRLVIEAKFPELMTKSLPSGKGEKSKYWWAGQLRDFMRDKYPTQIFTPWSDSNTRHFDAFVKPIDGKNIVHDFVINSDGGGVLYDDIVMIPVGEYNG